MCKILNVEGHSWVQKQHVILNEKRVEIKQKSGQKYGWSINHGTCIRRPHVLTLFCRQWSHEQTFSKGGMWTYLQT